MALPVTRETSLQILDVAVRAVRQRGPWEIWSTIPFEGSLIEKEWFALDDTIEAVRSAYAAHVNYYLGLMDASYNHDAALRMTQGISNHLRW